MAERHNIFGRQRLPKAEILVLEAVNDRTDPGQPIVLTDEDLKSWTGLALFTVGRALNNLATEGDVTIAQSGGRRVAVTEQGRRKAEGRG